MAQLMPLLLTVSCFSEIQIGFTCLVPAHPGSPGKMAIKWVCESVCVYVGQKNHTKESIKPNKHWETVGKCKNTHLGE